MATSVPAGDVVPPSPETGRRSYFADLWKAPPKAKAALVGCLLLMVVSPSGLSAMITFVVPSFAAATGVAEPAALLVFLTIPLLLGPISLPFAGKWVDRWGARRVAIPSAVAYAALTALVPVFAFSVPLLAVVLVLAGAFGFMTTLSVVFKVVSTWLPQHRGIGFALIGVVSSLASAVFSPLFQWLINGDVEVATTGGSAPASGADAFTGLGWTGTYFLVAAVIAVVAIPAAVFLISEPRTPQVAVPPPRVPLPTVPPPALAGKELRSLPGIPLRTAVRTRTWIFIALFLAFAATGPMAVRQNAVGFFGDRGLTPATVALSLSALFIASIVGLLLGGVILDRTDRPWVVAPIMAAVPVGLVLALVNQGSTPLLFVAMILLGFATGAESALGPYLIVRYFGLHSFAQLQGLTLAISTLALGLSPFLVSAGQAASGSYLVPVIVVTVLTAIGVVLAALLPKFPPHWKIDDAHQRVSGPV